jgi:hypothetical protein
VGRNKRQNKFLPPAVLSVRTIRFFGAYHYISLIVEITLHIKYLDKIGPIGEAIDQTGDVKVTDAIAGKALILLEDIETVTGLFYFHLDIGTAVIAGVSVYYTNCVVERTQDDRTTSCSFSDLS